MCTKKTFELAAEEIKFQLNNGMLTSKEREFLKPLLIDAFITVFRNENPAFNAERFATACDGPFSPVKFNKLTMVGRNPAR